MEIRWLGHATFLLSDDSTKVLIDPFLTDNPAADVSADEVEATQILLTHGHFDHVGDIVAVAKRTGANVLATAELASWCAAQGAGDGNQGANIGGTVEFDGGWAKLVPAIHTSQVDGGPASVANGFVVGMGGKTVYHLGDTALTGDFKLVADRTPIDVALVPIGGHYTMDWQDGVTAVELIRPKQAIPMHYDTWPPIAADPQQFKAEVEKRTETEVVVLEPGGSHTP